MPTLSPFRPVLWVLFMALGGAATAHADDDDDDGKWWKWGQSSHDEGRKNRNEGSNRGAMVTAAPAPFKQECAACHIAYPAGLLPASSWQHLMANLGQHYGSDASLDAASASAITQYLTSNAGTYKRVSEMPPQDRITASYWFQRKHNKHVAADIWARKSIGSPANCVACHHNAEQGDFNEHSVRIPG